MRRPRPSRLARHWRLALSIAVLAGGLAAAWSSTRAATYEAQTELLLPQADDAILTGQVRLVEASSELAATTAESVRGVSATEVLAALHVERTGSALTISARGSNPAVVRDIANTQAASYLALRGPGVLEGVGVISPAEVPTTATSPRPVRDGAIAFAMGLVIGTVLAAAWDRRRDRIRAGSDLRGMLPVLAEVPVDGTLSGHSPALSAAEHPDDEYVAAIQSMCDSLVVEFGSPRPRRILVTSTDAGEGKSLVAANLAWVAASRGLRTVLVGGDGRRPKVGALLAPYLLEVPDHHRRSRALDGLVAVSDATGPQRLATAMAGDHVVKNLSPTESPNLYVLSNLPGAAEADPVAVLGSGIVESVLEHLDGIADLVVIDTPPLNEADDAKVLASQVDDVVLVAGAGSASRRRIEESVRHLGDHSHRVRGVVVNRVRCRAHSNREKTQRTYRRPGQPRHQPADRPQLVAAASKRAADHSTNESQET